MKWDSPARAAAIAASLLALSTGAGAAIVGRRDGCATGLHIIAARGTGEAAGPGVIGTVANAVLAVVPGSTIVGLDYPATFRDYPQSEADGVDALQAAVSQYVASCSDGRIALLGYSQVTNCHGCHVI
jgi:hypothetical protein